MAALQVTCVRTIYPGTENRHMYWLGGPQFSKRVSEVIADIKYLSFAQTNGDALVGQEHVPGRGQAGG